ncbi:MAG: serine/threonine protein phosphatase [Planctomycetales bacterium]|nr:serine/threonine protein phosphatase [Planctomycetales bacterium]
MTGRTIAIGDIHGCSTALDSLLEAIEPNELDTVVTLGDYVDRGPNSKGVIDRLIQLSRECNLIALQGNHEEMMLDVVQRDQQPFRWLQYGGVETLDSYLFAGDMSVIPAEHHQFFDSMVDFYETEDFLFLHANYMADEPLEQNSVHVLRWLKLTESTPPPHFSGKRAIVGHTHDHGGEIFDIGHLVCIDTYCYGGGWLTALDCDSGEIWQTDVDGNLRNRSTNGQ